MASAVGTGCETLPYDVTAYPPSVDCQRSTLLPVGQECASGCGCISFWMLSQNLVVMTLTASTMPQIHELFFRSRVHRIVFEMTWNTRIMYVVWMYVSSMYIVLYSSIWIYMVLQCFIFMCHFMSSLYPSPAWRFQHHWWSGCVQCQLAWGQAQCPVGWVMQQSVLKGDQLEGVSHNKQRSAPWRPALERRHFSEWCRCMSGACHQTSIALAA